MASWAENSGAFEGAASTWDRLALGDCSGNVKIFDVLGSGKVGAWQQRPPTDRGG
jgi:hypothetical protein